ncbi:MAG: hypothetical protein RMK29_00680 [Myxococcales bacterium]|nr:hypothetical protein [Myxococcota bacterium]MDW8280192.1 hypothetical protein [Myxococcales bacterium]
MVQTLTRAGLMPLLFLTGCSLTFYGLKEVQDEPRPPGALARCPDRTPPQDTALAAARPGSRSTAAHPPAKPRREAPVQPAPDPVVPAAQPASPDTSPEAPSPSLATGP